MFTGLRGISYQREGMFLMARQNLDTEMNSFMSTLRQLGSAGNGALRDALGWAESRYWKAHAALFESGKIKKGRGRGGSVAPAAPARPNEPMVQRSPQKNVLNAPERAPEAARLTQRHIF